MSTKSRQAVILAGGKGTRLAERLNGLPKPLVDVAGVPLLQRQLQQLGDAGFDEVLVLVSHRKDAIEAFCAERPVSGLMVKVLDDGAAPRGTAGAVFGALEHLRERFLVVYGDTLFDIDLDRFWAAHHAAQGAEATLFLHPNDHPHDSDLVDLAPDGTVRAFHSKPHPPGAFYRNMVNAALYVIERPLIADFPLGDGIVDFGKDLFPAMLAKNRRIMGYATFEYIKDLGTPDRLDRVVADFLSGKVARARLSQSQKAVFLDRDGTLNVPAGYISTPEALELLPDVAKAVRLLNRAEFRCVVVTNQPVIARGECSIEGLERIHAKLETQLGLEGAFLDALYYCPHHPDKGFAGEVSALKIRCSCRKPSAGLLVQAQADLSIDFSRSVMIGDSIADIEAARAAGVTSILVRTGGLNAETVPFAPDFEFETLFHAAEFLALNERKLRTILAPLIARILPGTLLAVRGAAGSGKSVLCSLIRILLKERGLNGVHCRIGAPHQLSTAQAEDIMLLDGFDALPPDRSGSRIVALELCETMPVGAMEDASLQVMQVPAQTIWSALP